MTQPSHIGINAHLLSGQDGYRRAGIHQYIFQVLAHLPETADLRYTVFTRHDGRGWKRPFCTPRATPWPTENRLARIAWEQAVWPVENWRQQIDLVHGMAFATPLLDRRPSVVTVYDLSFEQFPDRFPRSQRLYLRTQTRLACAQARRVLTISESTRQDVHTFYGVPLAQFDVVRPGLDPIYQPATPDQIAAFKEKQGINGRYLLHVGTLQPRKNIPTLIDAFAQLNEPDLTLVLVGGKGWLFDDIFARVTQHGLQDRVRFTGYVEDHELPLWYAAADLFVFPSVYEGFGMPVVEAMACGTPVIAANSSSIPEAAGEAGLLFPATDVDTLVECIGSVLHDSALSAKMRQLGKVHAHQFSWARAGKETAVVYRRALAA